MQLGIYNPDLQCHSIKEKEVPDLAMLGKNTTSLKALLIFIVVFSIIPQAITISLANPPRSDVDDMVRLHSSGIGIEFRRGNNMMVVLQVDTGDVISFGPNTWKFTNKDKNMLFFGFGTMVAIAHGQ